MNIHMFIIIISINHSIRLLGWCLLIIATQKACATAREKDETQQDVVQVGGPEGKQVESLVAVVVAGHCLIVVGFIDGVNPHITSRKRSPRE